MLKIGFRERQNQDDFVADYRDVFTSVPKTNLQHGPKKAKPLTSFPVRGFVEP
jgi:hypothetical protein